MPGKGVVGDGEFHGLQALDLVAQAGGLFEFQVLGGLAHGQAQGIEVRGKVRADHGLVDLGGDPGLVGVALPKAGQHILDILLDGFGRNPVFQVVGHLLFAAAVGLSDGAFHAAGDAVGIHDDPAFGIAGGAADGLDQRGFRA